VDRILREQIALGSRRPGRLYSAIARRGIVEAVTSAVAKPTSGFQDLVRIGRLDLAMEWVVLDPRWKFPAYVRATAHARLRQAAQQRPIPAAIGEAYACRVLRLTPAPKRFQRDYDATDADGAKYQIKARTVTSLAEHTSFDFKRRPSGFDHFVGVLVTPVGVVLAVLRAPLDVVQRRVRVNVGRWSFRYTAALLTTDGITVVRKVG
jgi:hypothetical protein